MRPEELAMIYFYFGSVMVDYYPPMPWPFLRSLTNPESTHITQSPESISFMLA
jgi:hypothetical protein